MTTDYRATIASILRRWDGIANQQLIVVSARLAEENERLREQLRYAEDAAMSWRDDALRMMQDACAAGDRKVAITIDGALVTVPTTVGVAA